MMDISYIMQVFLGGYPGSRLDPDFKFIRAVNSFLDMKDPGSELIIVSDGCEKAHTLYHQHLVNVPNIKYAYVGKPEYRTNDISGQLRYFRGLPRQVGRVLASGYLTAYIDADDMLLKNSSSTIRQYWNAITEKIPGKDFMWLQCRNWITNEAALNIKELNAAFDQVSQPGEIEGLKSKWVEVKTKKDLLVMSAWSIIHRSVCSSKWQDTIGKYEDHTFIQAIKEEGPGMYIDSPMYVICHNPLGWDF
jgi:hypothetical protein